MTKKKAAGGMSYPVVLRTLQSASLSGCPEVNRADTDDADSLPTLSERIHRILEIPNRHRPDDSMIFFVMYDIESNKVRKAVAKYLLSAGCMRVQKSIFLADLPGEKLQSIAHALTAIQAMYENDDSIMIVPMPGDSLGGMKVIGQNISLDLILKDKTTLFF